MKFCILLSVDEREAVQKKTFTKWVNSHLQRLSTHANDLYHDLQDGRKLIMLLEILSGEKLVSRYFKSATCCFNMLLVILSPKPSLLAHQWKAQSIELSTKVQLAYQT